MTALSDTQRQIVQAMLALALMAIGLVFLLAVARIAAIRSKAVKRDELGRSIFPKWATQVSDCFINQFQMPILFYMICMLALWLRAETPSLAWLAWAFVGLRVAHAAVFVTVNFVPVRFGLYLTSVVLLAMMLMQVGRFVAEH